MKIAFFFNNLSNTGTNIATRDLIYQLKKTQSLECIDVFFFDKVENELEITESKIQISFFTRVDFSKYDIIHSSNLRSDFYVFFNKSFFSREKRIKYVTSVHSIIPEDLSFTYSNLVSKLISPIWIKVKKNNDAIVVSSDSMYNYYKDLFGNKNLSIIEYGRSIEPLDNFKIPETDIDLILSFKKKYKVIGTVGSLIKRKNYEAVISLLKKDENYGWICLGLGEEHDNLLKLLKENEFEDRVLFLGFKTDSRPYYEFFNLFFHPSRSEGFALVIIDAMSHKTPMLLSNLEVYKSIIKEDMAFYFELDDEVSLSDTFEKIRQGGRAVEKVVEKSFMTYEAKFSIEKYGEKHLVIFNSLIR
ncbi:glycosyltransferase [Flavobacterium chilense]|uniref:Glycosyltransferase involved in cell wall bisynthesis n=1 Tax=Flavobacterium chilense TaxID=946677 RepID=A0A1M7GSA2_9FLAO|nr:glycosyltransferase [Flavobacterium chilense]SHM19100.1 Glycosyltransferase involved in cell wall bisynthesis [Flavobacterium chilense]